MFFSNRAFNALSRSSRCFGDKSFLVFFVALIVVVFALLICYSALARGLLPACLCIVIHSQLPRRVERTRQYVLARRSKADMRVSHLSPAARNRQEDFWRFPYKCCLLLQGKHEISVARGLRGQRSKLPAADTKSRQSCMRVFFHSFKGQCDPAKISGSHAVAPIQV